MSIIHILIVLIGLLPYIHREESTTYHVATNGNDANSGTSLKPFRTIQKASDVAMPGDTILVINGIYKETVTIRKSNVLFMAVNPSGVLVDGENLRQYGFVILRNAGLSHVVIDGFEIVNQTIAGILVGSGMNNDMIIRNNSIHNIVQNGIRISGLRHVIENNKVYMIGNAQEAIGILLTRDKSDDVADCIVRNNQIYLCKKEGIRDRWGHRNIIESNIIYGCWSGIDFNNSTMAFAYNNYIYKCSMGFNPKHLNWEGSTGKSRIWHNTVWDASLYDISILDYTNESGKGFVYQLDVKNNIFGKAGKAHVFQDPDYTGPNITLDGNLYYRDANRPEYYYFTDYFENASTGLTSLRELKAKTGHEEYGKEFDPQLIDPENGNLDYPSYSKAAGGSLDLGGKYGTQLGARGLNQTTPKLIYIPMTAISASVNQSLSTNTCDNLYHTTWNSGVQTENQWIIYDLGVSASFSYIILAPTNHLVEYNIKNFAFEVSDDNITYKPLISGQNNDSGSLFIYELPKLTSARYLKFKMIDKFPDDGYSWTLNQIKFSDIYVARLNPENVD